MLNAALLSELEIVAHRGAESASNSLSGFLARDISIEVNGVSMAPIETIPEQLGSGQTLALALLARVGGEIEGNAVLMFQREDALQLVRALGSPTSTIPIEGFGELERSMMEETANITISSFMNSITFHLGKKCVPNAPIFMMDMAGAVLSVILMESAEVADQAIVFSTRFTCPTGGMNALFVFLPSPSSLGIMEEVLVHAD